MNEGDAAGTGPELRSLARAARVVFLICYFSLLGLMIGESWLENSIPVIWLVRLVPLLMFLPGIVRVNLRSHIWVCFLSLVYFLAFVQDYFAFPGTWTPSLNLIAVCGLFCSGVMFVRWHARAMRAGHFDDQRESEQAED